MHDLEELDTEEPWRSQAACRDVADPSIFFPARAESTEAAKAVCDRCCVRDECREFAERRGIKHGIFGGLSQYERRRQRSETVRR